MPETQGHRIALRDGWSAWRWVRLRGSGFPLAIALDLASPELAQRVDELLGLDADLDRLRSDVTLLCERTLEASSGEPRKALARVLKRLRARTLDGVSIDEGDPQLGELRAGFAELSRRCATVDAARAEAQTLLQTETTRTGELLRRYLGAGPFREALTWQNRSALHNGLDSLLRTPAGKTDKDTRQRELLVARYAQRYGMKNDTIGFFGPVGWGTLREDGPAIAATAGPSLLAKRTVYFEHWCIDALAGKLAEDPELKPYLVPRRTPTVRVEGTKLWYPIERSSDVPAEVARILTACDGEKTALAIANELLGDPSLELSELDEVYYRLDELVAQKLVTWTLEIPTGTVFPERTLRELLSGAGTAECARRGLDALDRLEQRRDAVAKAVGDAEALDHAFGALESTFAEMTGMAATRRGGQTYAGRNLLYEDCRRDVQLELGPAFLERLNGALALLLQSARWYTFTIAERYRAVFTTIYEGLRKGTGSSVVDYVRYRDQVDRYFTEDQTAASHIVAETVVLLKEHWAHILGGAGAGGERRIERTAKELADEVAARFRAPHPGWPAARYHSPDVLVAARDVAHAARGDYLLVLGELHVSANTLLTNMALVQHETPDMLVHAREVDIPEVRIAPLESRQHAMRADHFSVSRHDLHLELGSTRSWRPRSQVVAVADLVVEERGGTLTVRSRDGSRVFDAIAFFEQYLMFASLGHFSITPPGDHVARVTVDGVVIIRESWRFTASEIPVHESHGNKGVFERFVAAQKWAKASSLPRFVFYKVPSEPKPCFLDFASSAYVEIFAKMIAKADKVTLSEMLPSVDDAWLEDSEGRKYTSELRLALLDPEPWHPPATGGFVSSSPL